MLPYAQKHGAKGRHPHILFGSTTAHAQKCAQIDNLLHNCLSLYTKQAEFAGFWNNYEFLSNCISFVFNHVVTVYFCLISHHSMRIVREKKIYKKLMHSNDYCYKFYYDLNMWDAKKFMNYFIYLKRLVFKIICVLFHLELFLILIIFAV